MGCPYKRDDLIRGMAFDGHGLIMGCPYKMDDFIRGMAFDRSGMSL
jgi:hypothetical protein